MRYRARWIMAIAVAVVMGEESVETVLGRRASDGWLVWRVSAPRRSCTDDCASRGEVCIESQWPTSAAEFQAVLQVIWGLEAPGCRTVKAGSWQWNPAVQMSGDWPCYWKGDSDQPRCQGKSSSRTRRFCPCLSSVPVTFTTSTRSSTSTTVTTSSSSTTSTSGITTASTTTRTSTFPFPIGMLSVTWRVAEQGSSCMQECGLRDEVCVEHLWPSSEDAFEALVTAAGIDCGSIKRGTWVYNPVVYFNDERPCYWKGSGSQPRCAGRSFGKSRRLCPCLNPVPTTTSTTSTSTITSTTTSTTDTSTSSVSTVTTTSTTTTTTSTSTSSSTTSSTSTSTLKHKSTTFSPTTSKTTRAPTTTTTTMTTTTTSIDMRPASTVTSITLVSTRTTTTIHSISSTFSSGEYTIEEPGAASATTSTAWNGALTTEHIGTSAQSQTIEQVTWRTAGRGVTCVQECTGHLEMCIESVWPSTEEDFRQILNKSESISCKSIQAGTWVFNPTIFNNSKRTCYWKGEQHRENRCSGRGIGKTRRICPCLGKVVAISSSKVDPAITTMTSTTQLPMKSSTSSVVWESGHLRSSTVAPVSDATDSGTSTTSSRKDASATMTKLETIVLTTSTAAETSSLTIASSRASRSTSTSTQQTSPAAPSREIVSPLTSPAISPIDTVTRTTTRTLDSLQCQAPSHVSHSHARGACKEGERIENEAVCTTQCQQGFWPSRDQLQCIAGQLHPHEGFSCQQVVCNTSLEVQHGEVECSSELLVFGTICKVHCHPGYVLQGLRSVACNTQVEGSRHASFEQIGVCQRQECGPVQIISPFAMAVYGEEDAVYIGDSRQVMCMDGYRLDVPPPPDEQLFTLTCEPESNASEADATWTGAFDCVPIVACGEPPRVAEATSFECNAGSRWQEGDVCTFSCRSGFGFSGSPFVCDSSGAWLGNAQCHPNACSIHKVKAEHTKGSTCTDLETLPHAKKCTLVCQDGYEALGSYACSWGILVEIPTCVLADRASEAQQIVAGDLELHVQLDTLEGDFTSSPTLRSALIASIAEGIGGIAEEDVHVSDIYTIAIGSKRRLVAQSSDAVLRVEYEIHVLTAESATNIIAQVAEGVFKNFLKVGLETRLPGLRVVAISVGPPHLTYMTPSNKPDLQSESVVEGVDDKWWQPSSPKDLAALLGVVLSTLCILAGIVRLACRRQHSCCCKRSGSIAARPMDVKNAVGEAIPNNRVDGLRQTSLGDDVASGIAVEEEAQRNSKFDALDAMLSAELEIEVNLYPHAAHPVIP